MSYRKWAFRLDDMCSAILKIQRYVNGYGFEDFIGDEKTQDAVIRQLTIIGEAVTHLPKRSHRLRLKYHGLQLEECAISSSMIT